MDDIANLPALPFVISSQSLIELEEIKTNRNKSDDVKAAARSAARWLADHYGEYEVVTVDTDDLAHDFGLDMFEPDVKICCGALYWQREHNEPVKFVTHDLCCRHIAQNVLGLDVEWFENKPDKIDYTGFKEIVMDENEMAYFYEHQAENMYGLLVNEYIIIYDKENKLVDSYRWDGERYRNLYKKQIKSTYFEKLKPKDIYQSCLVDSIMSNAITAVSAPPGAGKSLLSLMCIFNLIENGQYDRVVILYNPVKVRGAFDQGYYSGNAIEKGLQQSCGHMLATKFGDQFGVELLIQQGKIKLVSLADCRGMEIRDNEILYMTEVQNTTVDLIKLALSRVSSGAKVIIEGDYKTQVDSYMFEGKHNGLRRVIEKFKGEDLFGYVELQNIWRSKIAQLAELL